MSSLSNGYAPGLKPPTMPHLPHVTHQSIRGSHLAVSSVHDLTDISQLEQLVDASDVIIVFLTGSIINHGVEQSAYMRSANCVREFRRAVETRKRIVFVRETDQRHGAVSLAAHRRDSPADLRAALSTNLIVPWYRVKAYLQVSLRHIAEEVLETKLRIPGDVLTSPLRIAPPPAGHYHLYVPTGNHGAAQVAALLNEEARHAGSELTTTSDDTERHLAQYFLLYLSGDTNNELRAMHTDIAETLVHGQPLLLVHEQRDDHNAVPFATIIERTPAGLLSSGIYTATAVPLYGGAEFQRVCLRIMLHRLKSAQQGSFLRRVCNCLSASACCHERGPDEVTIPLSPSMPPSFRASWSSSTPGNHIVPAGLDLAPMGAGGQSTGGREGRQRARGRWLLTGRTEPRGVTRIRHQLGADI